MQAEPDHDPFSLAAPLAVQRLGRALMALPKGLPRTQYLRRRIEAAPRLPRVRVLACSQREAAMGTAEGKILFNAFGALVTQGLLDGPVLDEIASAADELFEFGLLGVVRGERAEEVDPEWVAPNPPRGSLAAAGETLGRRKSLGRTAVGDELDRLIIDPHPDVIRNVMLNPRVREGMVVQLASRTTTKGPILQVIAESRFQNVAAVRRAVASNPLCPAALACRLMVTLKRSELLEVAHDSRLHAEVRAAARSMLESKPPRP